MPRPRHNWKGDVFVNIQGSEPLISPATVDGVCKPFQLDPDLLISTACVPSTEASRISTPHGVKVVTSRTGGALCFSRHPIPWEWEGKGRRYKHPGLYGSRRAVLEMLPDPAPSRLEWTERLEQLRFLENGLRIQVVTVQEESVGVDTKEELERVRPLLENEVSRLKKTVFPG